MNYVICDWIELFRIGRIVQTRQAQPWIQPEFLFQLHPMSKKQQQCLDILHGFTDKVNISKSVFFCCFSSHCCRRNWINRFFSRQVLQERKVEHKLRKAREQAQKMKPSEDGSDKLSSIYYNLKTPHLISISFHFHI